MSQIMSKKEFKSAVESCVEVQAYIDFGDSGSWVTLDKDSLLFSIRCKDEDFLFQDILLNKNRILVMGTTRK